jgi:hypothetical protein
MPDHRPLVPHISYFVIKWICSARLRTPQKWMGASGDSGGDLDAGTGPAERTSSAEPWPLSVTATMADSPCIVSVHHDFGKIPGDLGGNAPPEDRDLLQLEGFSGMAGQTAGHRDPSPLIILDATLLL